MSVYVVTVNFLKHKKSQPRATAWKFLLEWAELILPRALGKSPTFPNTLGVECEPAPPRAPHSFPLPAFCSACLKCLACLEFLSCPRRDKNGWEQLVSFPETDVSVWRRVRSFFKLWQKIDNDITILTISKSSSALSTFTLLCNSPPSSQRETLLLLNSNSPFPLPAPPVPNSRPTPFYFLSPGISDYSSISSQWNHPVCPWDWLISLSIISSSIL